MLLYLLNNAGDLTLSAKLYELELAFEETDAFAWLTKHAGSFGFEMS